MYYPQKKILDTIISSGGGHAKEKFIPGPLTSRAIAELLELFLPVTRGDLHLNKPGRIPRERRRWWWSVCRHLETKGRINLPRYRAYCGFIILFIPFPSSSFPCRSSIFIPSTRRPLLIYVVMRRQERDWLLMHFYWAIILRNLNPSIDPRLCIMARYYGGYING